MTMEGWFWFWVVVVAVFVAWWGLASVISAFNSDYMDNYRGSKLMARFNRAIDRYWRF